MQCLVVESLNQRAGDVGAGQRDVIDFSSLQRLERFGTWLNHIQLGVHGDLLDFGHLGQLFAQQFPEVRAELSRLAAAATLPPFAGRFAVRNPSRESAPSLDRIEQRILDGLAATPRAVDAVARTTPGVEALRRLVDRGLATVAGFTPSDALHVLGRQHGWCVEAARLGATVLAVEERNASGGREADTAEGMCQRTYEQVLRGSVRVVAETALARDPGLERAPSGPFRQLMDDVAAGRPFSRQLEVNVRFVTTYVLSLLKVTPRPPVPWLLV